MSVESPGAYAFPEDSAGRRECARTGGSEESSRYKQGDSADVYQPSIRVAGEADTECPEALHGVRDELDSWNCYCGTCSGCRCAAESSRDAPAGDESKCAATRESAEEPRQAEETDALSEEEQRHVEELQQRDREVRAHEQAHAAAGGRNVRYDYQTGPDGKQYAVGGSCDIDFIAASDDYETRMAEARKMRAAALAPADPSPQDMAVATKASRLEAEAMADKAEAAREEWFGEDGEEEEPFSEAPDSSASRFFALA